MAKKHKNLDNISIRWNGDLENPPYGAGNKNQNIPSNVGVVWNDNPYTWGEVNFVIEIADGLGTGRRRQEKLDKLLKDEEKREKLVHLICRVKGEKVYDEIKTVPDWEINVKVEDVDMVINEVLGSIKVEKVDVL